VSSGHAPFAVLNRTGNRVVAALLGSRLHPLGGRLALITVTGRRSGREFSFPVGYRRDGDEVTIRVGAPKRKRWWRNLREPAPVGIRIAGEQLSGTAVAREGGDGAVTVTVRLDPAR
jgi:F420H(2)-dependent quinone reductase